MATLDAQLLEILACPCPQHAPLSYDQPAQTLACPQCRRVFPIQDGIPVLLLDEALEGAAIEEDAAEGESAESGATRGGAAESGAAEGGATGEERHG